MDGHPFRRRQPRRWAVLALSAIVVGSPLGIARADEGPSNPPSRRGVQPVITDTGDSSPRSECRVLTGRDDVVALKVPGEDAGFPGGSPYTDGTLEVAIDGWDAVGKSFAWSSNTPVLGVWVKGGSAGEGNWYDYTSFDDRPPAAGADHDRDLHTKPNPNGPAGLSHVTFCYLPPALDPPDLRIAKSADATGTLRVGDRFSYEVVVTNVGGETAHGVEMVDELPAGLQVRTLVPDFDGGPCTVASSVIPGGRFAMSVTCRRSTLAPGSSATITFQVEVTEDARCGSAKNDAIVSADDEPRAAVDGGNTASHTAEIACTPSILLDMWGPARAHGGDRVTYRFVATNDGEADLHDVTVRDPGCDAAPERIDEGDGDPALAPGESWAYRCSSAIASDGPDPVRSSGEVVATDGQTRVSDTASHTTDVLHPAIELDVSVSPSSGQVGDTVTYRYVVTNTGDAPLLDVIVTDDVLGAIGRVDRLTPGRSVTLRAERSLPATDIRVVNVGSAAAVDELGLRVAATDDAFVTIVAADGSGNGDDGDDTGGGTAFTGGDASAPGAAAALLLTLGLAALAVSRPRPLRTR